MKTFDRPKYMSEYYLAHHDEIRRTQNDRRRANKDAHYKTNRAYRLRADFGITEETYEALFKAQSGLCAICKQPETDRRPAGKTRRLAVDHNHTTGKIRQLLCRRCNVALGLLKDSIGLLKQMIAYLEGYEGKT